MSTSVAAGTGTGTDTDTDTDVATRTLDRVFQALADSKRRQVLDALETSGGATVSELSRPHGMSLPGFMKHLRVLEDAGLVTRAKDGRVVSCALDAQPLQEAAMWLSRYEKFWNERLDALGRYLYHDAEVNPWPRDPSASHRTGSNTSAALASRSAATTPSRQKKSGAPGPSRRR